MTSRSFAHAITTRQLHNRVDWVLKLSNGCLYVKKMVYNTFRHGRESPGATGMNWNGIPPGQGVVLPRLGGNWEESCLKPSERPELH